MRTYADRGGAMLSTYNPVFNKNYDDLIKKLDLCGIIPLIKIDDANKALPLAGALIGADISVVEIEFRSGCAAEVIRILTERIPDLIVGAGTIINLKQLSDARDAGAEFIVTPAFSPAIVDRCIELGLPVFPGCATPTDIDGAYSKGLRVVKFFPAEPLGGIEMMKALSGPYPFVRFIPTGGIDLTNLRKYLAFGKTLCCAGTFVADEQAMAGDRFDEIARTAHDAIECALGIRLDHIALNLPPGEAEELLKSASRFAGRNYDPQCRLVSGIESVDAPDADATGSIVYSAPNLERCAHYLERRGFSVEKSKSKKENNRLAEICLLDKFGGFSVKITQSRKNGDGSPGR